MINRIIISTCFLFLLLTDTACTSSKNTDNKKNEVSPELILAQQRVPGITMEQLKHGNRIYIRNCSACHALRNPSQFTAQQWQPILIKMFVKAKIKDTRTKALIADYIVAKSK